MVPFGAQNPCGTRGKCRCCNRRSYKCSAFHVVFTPPGRAVGVYKKAMAIIRKKGRPDLVGSPSSFPFPLEVEPQPELHDAWVVCAGQMEENGAGCWVDRVHGGSRASAATRSVSADGVVLRVVEDVEGFPFEFESCLFVDGEALGSAEVKVHTAGKVQSVTANITERETLRNRECGWIVGKGAQITWDFRLGQAGFGVADQIGTGTSTSSISDTGVVTLGRPVRNAKRCSRLGDGDA